MGYLTLNSVRRDRDGVLGRFTFTDRAVGVDPVVDPILTYVFPTRLRYGISHASREALVTQASRTSWPFHSPQSVSPCATPSKHNDLLPPTYASGGPERDTGRCECSPPFLSDPVSPTKSLKGLGASSHQSPPPTLSSGVPTTSTGSLGSTASRHASVPHVLTPRVLDKVKSYSALGLHTRPRSLT